MRWRFPINSFFWRIFAGLLTVIIATGVFVWIYSWVVQSREEGVGTIDWRRSAQKAGLDAPDGRAIFEAAAAGDARTLAVLNGWINEIAQGLAGLVHIFNPQLILIGGGVSAQQALLIDPLAAQVRKSIMPAFAEGLEVRAAALQNDAGLVGAVYYFKQQ